MGSLKIQSFYFSVNVRAGYIFLSCNATKIAKPMHLKHIIHMKLGQGAFPNNIALVFKPLNISLKFFLRPLSVCLICESSDYQDEADEKGKGDNCTLIHAYNCNFFIL
ncbi:hypothetical protein E3J74_01805 [Candidatus Bathyarchaeota archaeon]|nr:MAG: hypothetical protein E3J74_01805 [Candidatus Bathyarchaeota archaeon]